MDACMLEISANDLAPMDARQTPEGMTYRHAAREDGSWDVVARSNKYWVAPERADGHTYHERYWSPTVLIRGSMAMVWAPYEFPDRWRDQSLRRRCVLVREDRRRVEGVEFDVDGRAGRVRRVAACRPERDPPRRRTGGRSFPDGLHVPDPYVRP